MKHDWDRVRGEIATMRALKRSNPCSRILSGFPPPVVLLILLLAPPTWSTANAQGVMGDPFVLRADGSQALHTETRSVLMPAASDETFLAFHFGFETDEVFGPGTIFDSFSIGIENEAGDRFATLLTADASGVVYAPATPGGVSIPGGAITASLIPVPPLNQNLTQRYAAYVQAFLPQDFAGQEATLYFDLFDNQNGTASLGWFTDLTVVPEPTTTLLLGLGALLLLGLRKRN